MLPTVGIYSHIHFKSPIQSEKCAGLTFVMEAWKVSLWKSTRAAPNWSPLFQILLGGVDLRGRHSSLTGTGCCSLTSPPASPASNPALAPAWLHTCTPSHLLHLPCTPSLQFAHQRHNLWFAHYLNCSNQALHWHDCTIAHTLTCAPCDSHISTFKSQTVISASAPPVAICTLSPLFKTTLTPYNKHGCMQKWNPFSQSAPLPKTCTVSPQPVICTLSSSQIFKFASALVVCGLAQSITRCSFPSRDQNFSYSLSHIENCKRLPSHW